MPSKSRSKRNRRYIPQNSKVNPSPVAVSKEPVSPAFSTSAKPATDSYTYKSSARISATETITDSSHFLSELKWIGVVTAIVVVLLIAAYYIFR